MTTGTIAGRTGEMGVDRAYAFKLVGLFGVGWLLLTADSMILGPLLPLIREDFKLSGTQTGLVTTAFYLPYLLMQMPGGLLADQFGPKRVLLVMMLVASLALGGIGLLATSLALLVILGALHRVGAGVYYPSAFGITLSSVPKSLRGVSSAVLSGGMAFGTGVGVAIAVPLAEFGRTWRFPYIVMAVATLLVPLGVLAIVRSGQRVGTQRGGGLGIALRDPRLWLIFGLGTCTNFGFTAIATWGPSFLHSERGLPLAQAGFYLALFNFIGFGAGFLMGRLSDRIGRRRLTIALFTGAALSIVLLTAAQTPWLILVGVVAYGLTGKWASDSPIAAWIGDRVATRYSAASSSVFAINNIFRMVSGLLAPLVTGALLDITGSLQTGLYVGAASLLVGAVLALLARDGEK